MAVTIKINIDPNTILKNHSLDDGGQAQQVFTNEVIGKVNPYVPLETSTLKDTITISNNYKTITYTSPYAHYQYEGISKNGHPIKNQGAPMRGKKWIPRMWADRGKDITGSIAKLVGGRAK